MPLSEQEKRALEELEAQLTADDPRFASTMVSDPHRNRRRQRVLLGALGGVIGIALLVVAVVLRQPLVGLLGFVVITLGVAHAVSEPKRVLHAVSDDATRRRASGPSRSRMSRRQSPQRRPATGQRDLMATLESRWERRRRESQGW